jgi:hydrogenase expression/formation protein HypE
MNGRRERVKEVERVTDEAAGRQSRAPYLAGGKPFRLDGVIFDFDGTLTLPGALDFAALHAAMGCPREIGLIEFLANISDAGVRAGKEAILLAAEVEASERSRPNDGATELVAFLRANQVPMAIITRNSRAAVDVAFEHLPEIDPRWFRVVLTRDLPVNPKPFPDAIHLAARELGVVEAHLLMIGDHDFDIEAGRRAGTITMFLRNDPDRPGIAGGADFVVDTLVEAMEIIRYGLPLPPGKLPADLLERGLADISVADPTVLVGAAIGEDAAAVDVGNDEVVVLASDPITLAADSMARYTVLVNANDVATTGADPRWLLSTLLFPPGSSASEVLALTGDIQAECAACGITLCGGHTEISDAVSRPLVVGTIAGTARRTQLRDKRAIREGDHILFTKRVAVEGTGLIAREFGPQLLAAGLSAAEIDRAATFLEQIGILEEARIARSFAGVTAMHDVTEGGLATAVRELGAASGRRLRLHLDRIPVFAETQRICMALDLQPLGLIGSGSLLITCSPEDAGALVDALGRAGIEVADIGEVLGKGYGVEAMENGSVSEWPSFDRDEVSRLSH